MKPNVLNFLGLALLSYSVTAAAKDYRYDDKTIAFIDEDAYFASNHMVITRADYMVTFNALVISKPQYGVGKIACIMKLDDVVVEYNEPDLGMCGFTSYALPQDSMHHILEFYVANKSIGQIVIKVLTHIARHQID